MSAEETPRLPVDAVVGELIDALDTHRGAVLVAPPGAGKTTRLPLALHTREAVSGRIVVLEPRRLAARGAARRLARELGEPLGRTVGLTTRDDRAVSDATRIELVTDGTLLRRLQRDPTLDGTDLLILDEFHERRLESDLSLAFALEAREALRDDLRLLVTSATLDPTPVARLLAAPVIVAEGRAHPVEVEHLAAPAPGAMVEAVVDAIGRALAPDDGDVLVFLPGAREQRSVAAALGDWLGGVAIEVRRLHGGLSARAQDDALAPAPPGRRRVVLSTDVAESSLTVPGVVAVVDAGLSREPRIDPRTATSGLVTVPASRASADQRAGRAGRLGPGRCLRLWSRAEHARRSAVPTPAIRSSDLAGAALEVACWGATIEELPLLDPPDPRGWKAAQDLLRTLGALDGSGRPTEHGRRLAELPLHPRLGHMVVTGQRWGHGGLACDLAALLADRDPLRTAQQRPGADLVSRLRALRGDTRDVAGEPDEAQLARIRRDADRLRRRLGVRAADDVDPDAVGRLVLVAYPDRLAAPRPAADGPSERRRGEVVLASGRGARLDGRDPLAGAPLLAVAHLDHGHGTTGQGVSQGRVQLAAAVDEQAVRTVLGPPQLRGPEDREADPAGELVERRQVVWRDGDVRAERIEHVGAVTLRTTPWTDAPDSQRAAALLEGLRRQGLDPLFDAEDRTLQRRLRLLHDTLGAPWRPVHDDALLAAADQVIAPFLAGCRRRRDLHRVPRRQLLLTAAGPVTAGAEVDRLAPTRLTVPSGSRVRIDYDPPRPVLAVKLQELFGLRATPTIVEGRVPLLIHLLSPAGRPVQVTDDLASFWGGGYQAVRAELRGRYPKHPWPEDPTAATPTAGVRRR